MCPPVGARVSHACVSGRAREVEKAVAFGGVGGHVPLSLACAVGRCGGGVGRGSRGYVNGAAVNVAQGFEWRWWRRKPPGWGWGGNSRQPGLPVSRTEEKRPCEPNGTRRCPHSSPPPPPPLHLCTPPFSPFTSRIGRK